MIFVQSQVEQFGAAASGCAVRATRKGSKTEALRTEYPATPSAHRSNRVGVGRIRINAPLVVAMTLAALVALQAPATEAAAAATRLHKRHSHSIAAEAPAWQNPCGGTFQPQQPEDMDSGLRTNRLPTSYYLKHLRRSVMKEFRILNATLRAIDISDIQSWKLRRHTYKFLPALKANSSVALKRWHRYGQIYVGAFAYLRRAQSNYEHSRQMPASPTSQELDTLFANARSLLCEIETTINGSYPQGHNKLSTIDRVKMNELLKFRTSSNRHLAGNHGHHEADRIDLKYAKYAYFNFMLSMRKSLRQYKRPAEVAMHSSSHSQSEEAGNLSVRLLDGHSDSDSSSSSSSSYSWESEEPSGNRQTGRRTRTRKSVELP